MAACSPRKRAETGSIYQEGWIDYNKNGVQDLYEDPEAELEQRVEDLLRRMTVEEKTCQMVTLYGYHRVLEDQLPTPAWKDRVWKDGVGTMDEQLNGWLDIGKPAYESEYLWPPSKHAEALNSIQRWFIEETRLGIPVDFTNEGIRGVDHFRATEFPTPLGLGATWDKELLREVGRITGREARLLGYTTVNAPILDVARDQRWGRYEECYGEDPFLVAQLGLQVVRGLQTDHQVTSCGKHFIVHGSNKGAREDQSRVDPQISRHEVENIHVYPWKEAIRQGDMLSLMTCYNDVEGSPVQGSKYWLTDRLRKDFGFRGYVISDSDAVEMLYMKHHTAADMKDAVRQAVEAGLNVRCTFRTPESYVEPLRACIADGSLPMHIINDRVRDILRVKFITGLFDHPFQKDFEAADREVDGVEHNAVALQAARESIVLLKNAEETLPLEASSLRSIAVIGPNADDPRYAQAQYGPFQTEVITPLEGLRRMVPAGTKVLYAKGCEVVDEHWPDSEIIDFEPAPEENAQRQEALALARQSDAIIAVMGGNIRTCGESRTRTSLDLPPGQDRLLKALRTLGKPLIVVLLNGRPLSVNWADRYADAIVEAWYPGTQGGLAIAEVLLGQYNPGGKLPCTFPKTVGQIPFNFPFKPNSQLAGWVGEGPSGRQTRINEGLYPFGFGLSYTTFSYSNLRLGDREMAADGATTVSVDVTNTGARPGDEVVQLYFSDVQSSITVYDSQLRGFERVSLTPGETRTVTFPLRAEDLSLLDEQYRRVVEPGDFVIRIGASSEDIRLTDTLTVRGPLRIIEKL